MTKTNVSLRKKLEDFKLNHVEEQDMLEVK